jgi:hypothetical protein
MRVLAGLMLVCLLPGCDAPPEPAAGDAPAQTEVAAMVREVVAAIGERDPERILRHVNVAFAGGPRGQPDDLDYAGVKALVGEFLYRTHPIGARLEDLEVSDGPVRGDERTQRATFRLWVAPSEALGDPTLPPPPSAHGYDVDLLFALREGTWQAITGQYQRFASPGS